MTPAATETLRGLLEIELRRVSMGATVYRARISKALQDLADGVVNDPTTRETLTSLLEVARQELGVREDVIWQEHREYWAIRRVMHSTLPTTEAAWSDRVAALRASAEELGVLGPLREVQPAMWERE